MPSKIAALTSGFAIALTLALASVPMSVSAQASGPAYKTDVKNSSGRDLDNMNDEVKGYNQLLHDSGKFVEISPEAQVAAMGSGINAIGGYDPYWEGKPTKFKDSDFARIKAAGFKTVRVPLFTFKHIVDTQGHLDPNWLDRLDHIIELAVKNKLTIILDEHDFDDCAKDTDACAILLPNIWYDLTERYKSMPNTVIFELLNEPHGAIDDKLWNAWIDGLVSIVRETNPTRNIIVGPIGWNSADKLDTMVLPAKDRHIIVTFHYYTPMEFTHQGANWAGPELSKLRDVRWTGTSEQVAKINSDFDKVSAWSKANNRPIFLGEYGSYGAFNPNIDDRAAWTRAISKAADDRGFARAYWYFEDGNGFGAWDRDSDNWKAPILKALIP